MVLEELENLRRVRSVVNQILVVDDDAEAAGRLKETLEGSGYQVRLAKDGGQAHSSFVMHKPDFVILELILPGETGFEICERFKQLEEGIPVLVLTVIDMADARNLAQRVGADGYMTKPFEPDLLLQRIPEIADFVWERIHSDQPRERRRVRFHCRCGKKFKVSPSHRGKSLTCPECGQPLVVPRHD